MTRTIRVLLAVLTVATGVLFAAPAAHASTTFLNNQWSGNCLDDTPQGFRMWSCNGTNPQRWIQHNWDDGTVRFQNVNTGRCIDHTYDFGLRTWECNSGQNQSWWTRYWNDGTRRYKNQGTGLCIADGTGGIRMAVCTSGTEQSWWVS